MPHYRGQTSNDVHRLIRQCVREKTLSVKGGCLDSLIREDALHIWCKEAITDGSAGSKVFGGEPPDSG